MAWAGLFLGMLTGFSATVLGYTVFDLPLWASLLLYPGAGLATAIAVIAALVLRSQMLAQPRLPSSRAAS